MNYNISLLSDVLQTTFIMSSPIYLGDLKTEIYKRTSIPPHSQMLKINNLPVFQPPCSTIVEENYIEKDEDNDDDDRKIEVKVQNQYKNEVSFSKGNMYISLIASVEGEEEDWMMKILPLDKHIGHDLSSECLCP